MADNKIGVEEARLISEVLKVNSSLTSLDLRSDKEKREKKKNRRMNDRE